MTGVRLIASCLLWLMPAAALAASDAPGGEPRTEPIQSDLTEETEVRRLFIDVEALDRKGRPMPGLTREEFKLRLNYVYRKITSVDDLCPCTADGAQVARLPGDARAQVVQDEIATRYVIYLDFAQLSTFGRIEAVDRAELWIRETLQCGEQVMIVAHASGAGVREVSAFTSDRERLVRALKQTLLEPAFDDPFASELDERMDLCAGGAVSCRLPARKDYRQIRGSLRSLIAFLTRLDSMGGRKSLLLFHENLTMFPGRLYAPGSRLGAVMLDGTASSYVPDHIELVGEVGAAATAARTEINPIVVGGGATWTVNFGANLSDFTGGEYNRNDFDAAAVLDDAGRGCKCIYRLGVEPPSAGSRIYRTKVKVRGRALPSRHRVHYLTGIDRWARRAEAVLTNPDDAWGLEIDAAIVPMRHTGRRWDLKVEVFLGLEILAPPGPDDPREWEVGALLAELETGRTWEMLGLSRIDAGGEPSGERRVLHERTFENLPAGRYELRAYVRDRRADTYGGAHATVDLSEPPAAARALGGGTPERSPHLLRRLNLPLRKRWDWIEETRAVPGESPPEKPDSP